MSEKVTNLQDFIQPARLTDDQTGQVAAAVTISGPCAYYTQEFIRSSSRVLLDTASKISENLGYKPPVKNKSR